MNWKETKVVIFWGILGLLVLSLPKFSFAQNYSSGSFTVENPVIDAGLKTSTSLNFGLGQSLSQIAIGKSSSASFQLWSGFQYYFETKANTLTATAQDAEVDLSWTVPQTYLGITVGSYEVGVGTVSGSYTFTNVGNVTSYTQTGLTNGTTYYFRIKALSPGGSFLVFSNEDSAVPTGVTPPPPPPPGGGGGVVSSVVISGEAYPNAVLTLVRDATNTSTYTANSTGGFQINLSSLSAGNYNFILYAIDTDGNRSSNLTFEVNVTNGVTSHVSDLVLSPTITTDYSIVKKGDTLTIKGSAAPSSPVVIRLDSESFHQAFNVVSSALGKYFYSLDTTNLALGNYTLKAYTTYAGKTSLYSLALPFSVSDRTVVRPEEQCFSRSDLNCDGRVDLVDFSILLYFWEGANDLSRNPRADIDKSGRVDIVDFSIMLYDWTG